MIATVERVDQAEYVQQLEEALRELARASRNLYAVASIHLTHEDKSIETSFREAWRYAESLTRD